MMISPFFLVFVALLTGLASIVIGMAARSMRVFVGCVVAGAVLIAGSAAAFVMWRFLL